MTNYVKWKLLFKNEIIEIIVKPEQIGKL